MRLVVDTTFILEDLNKSDIDFLKECSIYNHSNDMDMGTVAIIGQKIDLPEAHMEAFLDIVNWGSTGVITLERYATGRYGLKFQ